jgi:mRNA interferase MazF
VLIVSRDVAAAHLNRVIVAPVTRTIRSIPTEIALGADEGLDVECVASFDNLGPQPVAMLTRRIGRLADARVRISNALAALADC